MLILSKFKDYYDGVAHSKGIDKAIVYKREEKETHIAKLNYSWKNRSGINLPSYDRVRSYRKYPVFKNRDIKEIETFFVGFCGRIYALMVIQRHIIVDQFRTETETEFVYDLPTIKSYFTKDNKYFSSWDHNYDSFIKQTFDNRLQKLFLEQKTPVFLFHRDKYNHGLNLKLNFCLKEIEFFKMFDTYQAFQELEMFVGQQLCTEKDTLDISDKHKIIGKGFDYKTSFRKEKSGK